MFNDAPLPTPEMPRHRKTMGNRKISIAIARGSAKSSLVKKTTFLETLARPKFSVIYATSTGDNTKSVGQSIKDNTASTPVSATTSGRNTLRAPCPQTRRSTLRQHVHAAYERIIAALYLWDQSNVVVVRASTYWTTQSMTRRPRPPCHSSVSTWIAALQGRAAHGDACRPRC